MTRQDSAQPVAPCLEANAVAAYVDGRVNTIERGRLEAHLASCDRCYELVAEVAHAQEGSAGPAVVLSDTPAAVDPPAPLPFVQRRIVRVPAAIAAGIAVIVLIRTAPTWLPVGTPTKPTLATLVLAAGPQRTIDGRFTGGFPYAPLRSAARSARSSQDPRLVAAAGELEQAAATNPTPENLHGYGIAQVLVGRRDGVQRLEDALAQRPLDARYLSDVGVAYLARGIEEEDSADLLKALGAFDSAILQDSRLLEPRFNKAVVLERLGRSEDAAVAWSEYLRLDPDSGWSGEARRRLGR